MKGFQPKRRRSSHRHMSVTISLCVVFQLENRLTFITTAEGEIGSSPFSCPQRGCLALPPPCLAGRVSSPHQGRGLAPRAGGLWLSEVLRITAESTDSSFAGAVEGRRRRRRRRGAGARFKLHGQRQAASSGALLPACSGSTCAVVTMAKKAFRGVKTAATFQRLPTALLLASRQKVGAAVSQQAYAANANV